MPGSHPQRLRFNWGAAERRDSSGFPGGSNAQPS